MTKMIKMSLVAAVAVAGLSTTASAQSLENAIKGVSVKGYFQYRWDKNMEAEKSFSNKSADSDKFRVQATAKANDKVSLTLRATAHADRTDTNIDRSFLTFKSGKTTALVGRISDLSPFTDGMGVFGQVALYKAGSVTLGAAYYNLDQGANKAADAKDLTAITAMGKAGKLSYAVWYVDNKDTNKMTSVALNTKLAGLGLELMYASREPNAGDTQTQTRIMASGKAGSLSYKAGVVMIGADGGAVAMKNGSDSKVEFGSDKMTSGISVGAGTMIYAKIGTKLNANMGISAQFASLADDHATESSSTDMGVKVTYKLAKNTSSYVRYNVGSQHGTDKADLRIQLKYSF
jgi:hypothetical protein